MGTIGLNKFVWIILIFFSASVFGEQKKTLGSWDVHYMVVNTTFLTPEVARNYDITRSPNLALINISVLDRQSNQAQSVDVSGQARTLLGSTIELDFEQVKEGEAIYYLATLPFDNEEHYRFTIELQQGKNNQLLKFEQKLYD